MKKIIFLLLIDILFGVASPLFAQSVSGKYKGVVWVKMNYVSDPPNDDIRKVECDGKDLADIVKSLNRLESKIKEKDNEIKKLNETIQAQSQGNVQGDNHINNPDTKAIDNLRQQNDSLFEVKWNLEEQLKSLQDTVRNLKKSLHLLNDSLGKVNKQLADLLNNKPPKNTFSHAGAYYRIGTPWLINDLFNQKEGSEKFWNRQMTLSHQVGVYWNSASFSDKLPMTCGVGLEYSRLKFSAGIGHLKDTLWRVEDTDGDFYTAYYTYSNVAENATLHYLSIPLSFSIGAPRTNRISGYFQFSLVPSFLIGDALSTNGTYSLAGHYDNLDGSAVDLYLDDFPRLGFGSNMPLPMKDKASVKRFMMLGRLSGGVYIPLCNTAKEQTSQWALKVGVNLDMSLSPIAKQKDYVDFKSKYQLDQYNLLPGRGCWYINPGLEVGILYMFNK